MQGGRTALHGAVGSTALHIAARNGHTQVHTSSTHFGLKLDMQAILDALHGTLASKSLHTPAGHGKQKAPQPHHVLS